jgi:hypothetical protein
MKTQRKLEEKSISHLSSSVFEVNNKIPLPVYIDQNYWWAYVDPRGVIFFLSILNG